jgi:sec-independent protein translocase protein TatA
MGIGFKELLVILVVVLLVFGTKKLRSLGGDLGSAIKDFKKNITDDKAEKTETTIDEVAQTAAKTEQTDCTDPNHNHSHDHSHDHQPKS